MLSNQAQVAIVALAGEVLLNCVLLVDGVKEELLAQVLALLGNNDPHFILFINTL